MRSAARARDAGHFIDAIGIYRKALSLRANSVEALYQLGRMQAFAGRYPAAPERQREVFQPFNRLGAESKSIEGTGIGLSICWRLVHMMNGRIAFASELGEGSEFWVDLPLAENDSFSESDEYGDDQETVQIATG